MILTPWIVVRLCLLGLLTALVQVTFFAKIELFGASPDGAALVVMTLGLLGGSVTGAVSGFSIGLVIDCLLFQTLGAFAATYMCVGYVGGRYRETTGQPTRAGVALLGGGLTLLAALAFAAIQIGTGVDGNVSARLVGEAAVKTLLGCLLALPVYLLVRLALRAAVIDDRPPGRRPLTPRAAQNRS
ncbi:MAG: rod shape-determining protein MreD [Solirubrobacterales bacterium]